MEQIFWEWLREAHAEGSLTEDEINEACNDEWKAHELFIECWNSDKYGTGHIAQEEVKAFKRHLASRAKQNGGS